MIYTVTADLSIFSSQSQTEYSGGARQIIPADDNFNDASINTDRWTVIASLTAAETGNKLRIAVPTLNNPGVAYGARVLNAVSLVGDFDYQADFDASGINTPSNNNLNFWLQVNMSGDSFAIKWEQTPTNNNYHILEYDGSNHPHSYTWGVGKPAAGKLRITRVGTTLTAYHWTGGVWVSLGTNIFASGVGTCTIFLDEYTNPSISISSCYFYWDNFQCNSGNDTISPGWWISETLDFGADATSFGDIDWTETSPGASTVEVLVRSQSADSAWPTADGDYSVAVNGADISGLAHVTDGHRYIRVKINLVAGSTPTVSALSIDYGIAGELPRSFTM